MKPNPNAAVKSANRAIDILEYVADAPEPPSFSAMLAQLGIPRSSLFHLLNNLLARGYMVVPTDRMSRAGEPVNGVFAVARALHRVLAFRPPARAVAVIDAAAPLPAWPEILKPQVALLPELLRALGMHVVTVEGELDVVASYTRAAVEVLKALIAAWMLV